MLSSAVRIGTRRAKQRREHCDSPDGEDIVDISSRESYGGLHFARCFMSVESDSKFTEVFAENLPNRADCHVRVQHGGTVKRPAIA